MFSAAEKLEARRLVEAGISARKSLRAIEALLPMCTTDVMRAPLVSTFHPILEVVEGVSNALSFLTGAIAVRGDQEKPAARLWPRQTFLDRAYKSLGEAIQEGAEATDALNMIELRLTDNQTAMTGLAVARNHLQRALGRILAFNQNHTYLDPNAWNADPLLQRDVMTNLYRSSNQYLYDSLEALLDAYSADPPIMSESAMTLLRDSLAWGWLIQDDLAVQTARMLDIAWVPGENPIETAFWTSIAETSPRFQFYMTYASYLLKEDSVAQRPKLQGLIAGLVLPKGLDSWKRFDYYLGLLPVMAGWMKPRQLFGT
jgi:hypothetical protein